MKEVKFILPKYWTTSEPILVKEETEMENMNSAGAHRFSSRVRYWGLKLKCIRYFRLHLFDKSNKKIKTVGSNFLDYKVLSLGSSIKTSFLIEVPKNVAYVKIEPMLENIPSFWYDALYLFGLLTMIMFFVLKSMMIIF